MICAVTNAEPGAYAYYITVTGPGGEPIEGVEVTVGEVTDGFYYAEYWTGPSPWWKRAWRRLRGAGRSEHPEL
jgi:hypothetical protein